MCLASMQILASCVKIEQIKETLKMPTSELFIPPPLVIIHIVDIRFKEPPQCAK